MIKINDYKRSLNESISFINEIKNYLAIYEINENSIIFNKLDLPMVKLLSCAVDDLKFLLLPDLEIDNYYTNYFIMYYKYNDKYLFYNKSFLIKDYPEILKININNKKQIKVFIRKVYESLK
jgi:hypothetical protein